MGKPKGSYDPAKEEYWRQLFKKFRKSQLPFKKFCQQENISSNTFQFWRKELRRRDELRGVVSTVTKGENRPSQLAEKVAYWKQVIADIKAHPGSVNSFCRKNKISSASLHYWTAKLKKMNLLENSTEEMPAQKTDFIPLKILEPEVLDSFLPDKSEFKNQQQIDFTLNDGTKISAPSDLSLDVLLKLVNGLRL